MRKLILALTGFSLPVLLLLSRGLAGASPQEEESELAPQAAPQRQAPLPQPRQPSPYEVTPRVGPWLIFAAHYTGQPAAYLADQVVHQLREKKYPAYTFNYADKTRRQ